MPTDSLALLWSDPARWSQPRGSRFREEGPMTADTTLPLDDEAYAGLQKSAREHLWMHFTRMSSYQKADVPVITMSGGGFEGTVDLLPVARSLGAAEILSKPFAPRELLRAVSRALGTSSGEA